MTERLEVYRCDSCHAMAAMMRGGTGSITCCGNAMSLYQETPEEIGEGNPLPVNTPTMEHNLNMPIKSAIDIMQRRLTLETTYFGVRAQKCPLDFWVYREIIFEIKPDIIIEIGNNYGGSTYALAHICDNLGQGRIVGVDIDQSKIPDVVREHSRVNLIEGDGCDRLDAVKSFMNDGDVVLVIEDSSHTYENTLNVMRAYGPLVTPGSYLIVEDSNSWHGLDEGYKPGPYEAIETYITETDRFEIDRSREAFFITWNPIGYLRCKD